MKKSIMVLFILLAVLCGATIILSCATTPTPESDFEVTTEHGQVTITKYTGSAAAVVIPATIGGKSVAVILDGAFRGRKDITSISIPASVTSMMSNAVNRTSPFLDCTSLIAILVDTNNNHYTSRNGVLYNKTGNMLIAYPAGLKGQYVIPSGITGIDEFAFYDRTNLTSISIPESVTEIGSYAFGLCTGLTSVSIPGSVVKMGYQPFVGCTNLTTVNISRGVTNIGEAAFINCTGLTTVSIPEGLTQIWDGAFYGCTGLTSIRIGANVAMNDSCFENNFSSYYTANGSKAGTYTFRNGAWSYAAQ